MNSQEFWAALSSELGRRLREPLRQPSFVMYFLLALVLGATGVWIALVEGIIATSQDNTQQSLFRALLSFFPAIGSLACVHVIIVEDSKKSLRALFVLLLIAFVFLAILAGVAYPQSAAWGFTLTGIGTALAPLSWWLANADQERFKEITDPGDAIGGPAEREPAGDTEGFAT